MRIINNEMVWCFDVDGTLIEWGDGASDSITLVDPLDDSKLLVVLPNKNNIRLLKEKKNRGCCIIVWSQGGFAHATQVIEALNLQLWVDLVMTKPAGIVDDLDPSEWLPKRVMIPISAKYK